MSKRETIKDAIAGWLGDAVYQQMHAGIELFLRGAEKIEATDVWDDDRLNTELRRLVHLWMRAKWEDGKP